MAALVLEPSVWLDGVNHAVIHMVGVKENVPTEKYIKLMIHHVIASKPSLETKNFYFVHSFSNFTFKNHLYPSTDDTTPASVFLDMKFQSQGCKALSKLLIPQSAMLFGKGSVLKDKCGDIVTRSSKSYRVMMLHDMVKVAARFKENYNLYETYSHPYGWNICDPNFEDDIPPMTRNEALRNPGTMYKMQGGGAKEDDEYESATIADDRKAFPIDKKFLQENHVTKNNCVWLSAALLITQFDSTVADKMVDKLDANPDLYEWMFLTKIPSSWRDYKDNRQFVPLQQHLQEKDIGFQLCKVSKEGLKGGYYEYLFHKDRVGKYLCQLEAHGGAKTHVIGVDCDNKVIVDCHEPFALTLTEENLNHCCGPYFVGVRSIPYCLQLKPQLRKQSKK